MEQVFSREVVFLLALSVAGEVLGNVWGFYRAFPAYDIVTHFVGGALVSSIAIKFLYRHLKHHSYVTNIVFTLGIGALWEILEFSLDLVFGLGMQPSLADTMVDLVMVTGAAIVVNFIYYYKTK